MLKFRLTRVGKIKQPQYRVVVAASDAPIQGKYIESVGFYNPTTKSLTLEKEKIAEWLKKGVTPSNTVAKLMVQEKVELPEWVQIKKFPERPSKATAKKESEPAKVETKVENDKGEETPKGEK